MEQRENEENCKIAGYDTQLTDVLAEFISAHKASDLASTAIPAQMSFVE